MPVNEKRTRLVERAVLEEIVDLDPRHLASSELLLKIVGKDPSEAEAILQAIRDLTEVGLLQDIRGAIAPTQAALRSADLLVGL